MSFIAPRFHQLPLRGLAVFEAAARHGRFTGAAAELLMSQARVSQQISALEAELGVALFRRRSHGVQLTSAGTALRVNVEEGLRALSDGVDRARRQAGQASLQILTDYGFAAWWLMPRLSLLNQLLPGIEVRIATTQADVERTDAEFDLAIMFGRGEWSGYRTTPLFPEQAVPVCSPACLAGRTPPLAPHEIAAMRLLHLRAPQGRWFTWADWHEAHGLPAGDRHDGLTFDNFQLVLQAALFGQGACIGWTPLIDDALAAGGLVALSETPLRSERGYHVVEHAGRPPRAGVAELKDWLLAARPQPSIAATPPPGPNAAIAA